MATKTTAKTAAVRTNAIIDVVGELDVVAKQREEWEAGAYKTSNDQLYAILARCLDLYVMLTGRDEHKLAQRRLLDERLTTAGINYKDSTPLATKVVRYVFRNDRRRSHTYARVIMSANDRGVDSVKFASWVRGEGGIEEVKRKAKDGMSTNDRAKQRAAIAEEHLYSAKALATFTSVKDVKPSAEAVSRFSYAIIRTEDDGTAAVVYGGNNAAVIKLLLARAGKEVADKAAEKAKNNASRARKNARATALSKVA